MQVKYETSLSKRERTGLVVLILWMTLITILVSGYTGLEGGNLCYSIVLVQKVHDSELYPYDPFVETAFSYFSVFWYLVVFLTRWIDVGIVLLGLFVASRFLLSVAVYDLIRYLFSDSRFAVVAALGALATIPTPLVGHGAPIRDFAEQTTPALACSVLTLSTFLKQRWVWTAFWLLLTASLNGMFGIFAFSYIFVLGLFVPFYRRQCARWLPLAVLALAPVATGVIFLRRFTNESGVSNQEIFVWQVAELSYPYHFFMSTNPTIRHIGVLVIMLLALYFSYSRVLSDTLWRFFMRYTTLTALFWYVVAWVNPMFIHSLSLLQLHPIRGHDLWYILIAVFFAGIIAYRVEKHSPDNYAGVIQATLLVLVAIFLNRLIPLGPVRAAGFIAVLSSVGLVGLLLRSIKPLRLRLQNVEIAQKSMVFGITLFVSIFGLTCITLNILGSRTFAGVHYDNHAVRAIARWAQTQTPKTAVFLIPLDEVNIGVSRTEGWHLFRHLSQRNVYVTRKDGVAWPYAPWYAPVWLTRMRSLGLNARVSTDHRLGQWAKTVVNDPKLFARVYDSLGDVEVKNISKNSKIDYWIVKRNKKSRFKEVYSSGDWKVLLISES